MPSRSAYMDETKGDFNHAACNIFIAAEAYVSAIATANSNSQCKSLLRASTDRRGCNVFLSVDDSQLITDTFTKDNKRVDVNWRLHRERPSDGKSSSSSSEKRYFMLTFNGRRAGIDIIKEYLKHVMVTSEKIALQDRQLKLFTNRKHSSCGWDMVMFNHPASFDTFVMDPMMKKKIMDDLDTFSKSGDYYKKIGKAWKRGYLLYGPPGTGKSTMIACIANYLKYDVFDVELTAVMSNTHLRQLVVNMPSRAVMVIEDIDCSLDLAGAREQQTAVIADKNLAADKENDIRKRPLIELKESSVTLSGLLNCIDGLWSTCGGERIVVFTTNHVDKLDPALIRKGRMDVQVELSFCKFEGFKVLARNYLGLDEHPFFERVAMLLEEVEITPADVAEQLLPKSMMAEQERAEECLQELIKRLEEIRGEARRNRETLA